MPDSWAAISSCAGLALSLVVGCRSAPPPAAPVAARPIEGARPAPASTSPGRGPLLVARLDDDRVAVLLGDAPSSVPTSAPTLLMRNGMLTAGVAIAPSSLAEEARARLAPAYRFGAVSPSGSRAQCVARVEGVYVVGRAVADDPMFGAKGGESNSELAAIAMAGDRSAAAVVALGAGCPGDHTLWAVAEGEASPAPMRTRDLSPEESARVAAVLEDLEAYRDLPWGPEWQSKLWTVKLGDQHAWVVAVQWSPGSPHEVCALFDLERAVPRLVGVGSYCPEQLEGATSGPDGVTLWFEHAIGRTLDGGALAVEYFPAAVGGTYGAP